jgi:hypothetical protein
MKHELFLPEQARPQVTAETARDAWAVVAHWLPPELLAPDEPEPTNTSNSSEEVEP